MKNIGITKLIMLGVFFVQVLLPFQMKAQEQSAPLYKKASAPVEARVKDLLQRMTLQEKIAQMRHIHSEHYDVNGVPDMKKLEEYTKGLSFGCIEAFTYSSQQFAKAIYHIQQNMVEHTRLGIPAIPIMEGLHGTVQDGCTIYPQAIALGSTFNPLLVRQMSQQIAMEMKTVGVKQVLAPNLDLARELRWGRVEETYGEDPFLNGLMGVAYVKGLQENDIICTPKHFVAHGSPLGGLNLASVEGGQRQLLSLYLHPFEKVIKEAAPLSIMNAYSSYDGIPITGSEYFMTDILRKKLGFKGYVYSDWGSVSMLSYFHHTAKDGTDAALQAVKSGIDLEAGGEDYINLENLVKSDQLDIRYIDRAVSNILYAKFVSGLFEHPYPDTTDFTHKIHTAKSIKLAKEIADESMVLLKNENNLLPLNMKTLKSIAIIGPNADQVQFGDYSWSRNNKDGVTPLEGIRNLTGNSIQINYAKGCDLTTLNKSGFDEAVLAAQKSEVIVVFVGSQSASLARDYSNSTSGEGFDLSDLKLPGVQEELVHALQASGKPIVLVLVTGKPFAIPELKKSIPAIVVQWYGGEQEGNSIADMLFGNINPSGKLPVSFPQSVGHLPVYYNYLPTDKGFYKNRGTVDKPGRDYVFSNPDALWSFGYGLSYTKFEYQEAILSKSVLNPDEIVSITIQVKNTGSRDGQEVVQLYVKDLVSSVVTPVKQLKGFKKVFVKTGETVKVQLQLSTADLWLYDKDMKRVVEPGEFELQIGSASDYIHIKKMISVTGEKNNKKVTVIENNTLNKKMTAIGTAITITGVVRDVQATALAGVKIKVKSSGITTFTNVAGLYTINATTNDLLQFSLKGYGSKEMKVATNKVINVKLIPTGT